MDKRKEKLLFGLRQLPSDGLHRILDTPTDEMVLEGHNYEPSTGRW